MAVRFIFTSSGRKALYQVPVMYFSGASQCQQMVTIPPFSQQVMAYWVVLLEMLWSTPVWE